MPSLTKVTFFPFEVPNDFPSVDYLDTDEMVRKYMEPKPMLMSTHQWFLGGWSGLATRYRACFDHDDAFTRVLKACGPDTSGHPQRYEQEHHLFGFFMNGFACFDCFSFAICAVGRAVSPHDFSSEERSMTRSNLMKGLANVASARNLYSSLNVVFRDAEFKRWADIRNVLAHRIRPGRKMHLSVGSSMSHRSDEWLGIEINPQTTMNQRASLTSYLAMMLRETVSWLRLAL